MTPSTPLVSIVMPCYNSAAFLERTLESIIGQSYPHWELILVDDGSSDHTSDIATRFSEIDRRIGFYSRPENYKRGGRGAKNYGFTLCKGTYVVFFDSDDYMLENYLADRVETLLNHPDVDVVFSDFGWKVPQNLIPKVLYRYPEDFNEKFVQLRYTEAFWKSFTDLNFFWVPSNLMWKKSSINHLTWNEDTTIGEDFEFNTRAILDGLRFYCIHQVNWYYMRNENSMIATSETVEQLEKRSFFMYLVALLLTNHKQVENTDVLVVHLIKHQYRILRRICMLKTGINTRKKANKMVIRRVTELINKIAETESRNKEKQNFKNVFWIVWVALYTRRGYILFERFLVGKPKRYYVLSAEFF